ncbi:MAG: hypothetical protein ACRDCI_00250, partial [Plesiomonas shigelloides]
FGMVHAGAVIHAVFSMSVSPYTLYLGSHAFSCVPKPKHCAITREQPHLSRAYTVLIRLQKNSPIPFLM